MGQGVWNQETVRQIGQKRTTSDNSVGHKTEMTEIVG